MSICDHFTLEIFDENLQKMSVNVDPTTVLQDEADEVHEKIKVGVFRFSYLGRYCSDFVDDIYFLKNVTLICLPYIII